MKLEISGSAIIAAMLQRCSKHLFDTDDYSVLKNKLPSKPMRWTLNNLCIMSTDWEMISASLFTNEDELYLKGEFFFLNMSGDKIGGCKFLASLETPLIKIQKIWLNDECHELINLNRDILTARSCTYHSHKDIGIIPLAW